MAGIVVAGVSKAYEGKEVVHAIDLGIEDKEFVVIVGPSGCGKSTLLRMIAGLEAITAGTIAIDGEVVNEVDPADRGCAMVFQNYALYPHMTVAQNMDYPLKIARLPKLERARRVQVAAEILALGDYMDRRPNQLSGGQRQRVAMGRAIVREPKVFLFDEPLSNLDAKLRVQMRLELRRLHRRLDATSIFVTHDQVEAMTLADKLVVMNKGNIEQIGAPADVYREPATTFVAGFLGAPAMNLLPATVVAPGEVTLDAAPRHRFSGLGFAGSAGDKVIVGIRPEGIAFAPRGTTGIEVRLDLIEELGGSRIAYCSLAETELAMIIPQDLRVGESALLHITFPREALHLFDAQSGRRLSREVQEEAAGSIAAE